MRNQQFLAIASTIAALAVSAEAQATIKWTFGCDSNAATAFPSCSSTVSPTLQYEGKTGATTSAVTVSTSAWADTSNNTTATGDVGNKLVQGNVKAYSGGLGVQWRTPGGTLETSAQPEHSMDNRGISGQSTTSSIPEEFILLTFTQAIALTEVAIGWYSTDSDISLLAYTGPDVTSAQLNAKLVNNTYSHTDGAGGSKGSVGLVNDGWSFVGHYANLHETGNKAAVNAGGVKSSYWLVGAYNNRVSPTGDNSWTADNDYIKLAAVSGIIPTTPGGDPVPVPGTLALLALGFPLLRRVRAAA